MGAGPCRNADFLVHAIILFSALRADVPALYGRGDPTYGPGV